MKTSNLLFGALAAAAFAASLFVGCTEIEPYVINAPDDLQAKIDSIAAEKAKRSQGDTLEIAITKSIVGNEDCSSAWWADHSQSFCVPSGKLLHFEFVNHSSKNNNWSNWNIVCTTTEGTSTDDNAAYAEYFVIRSDAYGWGNSDYSSALLSTDYFEEGKLADWDEFKNMFMDGAYCTIEVDHAKAGCAYVTAYSYNSSYGYGITETYSQTVPATDDIYINITTDESYFDMKSAYTVPSKIEVIPDENPVSITVAGTPAAIELGDTDFWGGGVATVTFSDGTTAVADTTDISFNVPDLSTTGIKTIVYSYGKTKQGNIATKSVNGYYTLEVTNPITAIEAQLNAYTIGGAKWVVASPAMARVTATYADGTKALLNPSQFTAEFTQVAYETSQQTVENACTVSFTKASGETITATADLNIISSDKDPQTTEGGARDFSNVWWTTFSQDWTVPSGENYSVSMTVGSDNLGNWHSPCTILRAASLAEYAVVRMDNYGWGDGYNASGLYCDWNWDTFLTTIDGSQVAVTVCNNGNNTASIRYYVISGDGSVHVQFYDDITVAADDLQFAFVTEESYLVFD